MRERIEQAAALPVWRGGSPARSAIVGARSTWPPTTFDRTAPDSAREPEHQRHVHVFLVHRPPLDVAVVRIAERLSMIAGDDDERVLVEAGAADRVEEPSEMAIRLVQDVQIPPEIVLIGHRLAQQLEQRHARRRLIRVMRLRGPRHQEERARRLAVMNSIIPSTMHRSSTPHDDIVSGTRGRESRAARRTRALEERAPNPPSSDRLA